MATRPEFINVLGCCVATAGLCLSLASTAAASPAGQQSGIVAIADEHGVELREGGQRVLSYRTRPAAGEEAWRVNYLHPLLSSSGVVLTENAPPDHLHQRGIWWAWRRVVVDGVLVGDGWVGQGLRLDVRPPVFMARRDGSGVLRGATRWHASVAGVDTALVDENLTLVLTPLRGGERRLDLRIELRALHPGVSLAGTDDEKGYGGFSIRLARSPQLEFSSEGRTQRAQVGAVRTGEWLTLRWRETEPGWPESLTIRCRIDGRTWRNWVLRKEASMQNCAFPGREPHAVRVHHPLVIEATLKIRER